MIGAVPWMYPGNGYETALWLRPNEAQAESENDPAEKADHEEKFAFLPSISNATPEGCTHPLNKGSNTSQRAALGGIQTELFEINGEEGEQRAKSGVEEEVKEFEYEEGPIYW